LLSGIPRGPLRAAKCGIRVIDKRLARIAWKQILILLCE
jgi:hypothetical protein